MNSNYMDFFLFSIILFNVVSWAIGGISPVHDLKLKLVGAEAGANTGGIPMNSPHRVLQHLDESILKATKNVTQNTHLEETLTQISKDLVSTIINKLEIQDKITRITREALDASGKSKGITAIETRRILDFISKTLSGHILSITKTSTEPELHRLVYGLAQIAAEVSIVSALDDITYTSALSKKQSVDISVRKKRSTSPEAWNNKAAPNVSTAPQKIKETNVYDAILNKSSALLSSPKTPGERVNEGGKMSMYSVMNPNDRRPVQGLKALPTMKEIMESPQGFLNQSALNLETKYKQGDNESQGIVLDRHFNGSELMMADTKTSELHKEEADDLNIDEDTHDITEGTFEEKTKAKMEKLENKAKKAILYAGDVAYLTAASVVAMRRALTASTEVQMSMKLAKTGMSHHQELMMNLARTAAQQAGKEAKSATSKSLACDRVIKMALKYTAQSRGAKLNHVANRIVMDTVSLATLAKSMAFVSSDIAINSLYEATDVKPPAT